MPFRAKHLFPIFVVILLASVAAYGIACWQSREPFQCRYVAQHIDATHGDERRIITLEVKNTSRTPVHCLHALFTSSVPWHPGNERLPYGHYVYASGEEYPGIWMFTDLETLYNRYRIPHALGPINPGETRRVELELVERDVKRLPMDSLCVRYEWVPMLRVRYWKCREWIRSNLFGQRFPHASLQDLGFTRTANCPVEIPLRPWSTLSTKPGTSPSTSPAP